MKFIVTSENIGILVLYHTVHASPSLLVFFILLSSTRDGPPGDKRNQAEERHNPLPVTTSRTTVNVHYKKRRRAEFLDVLVVFLSSLVIL